MRIKKLLFTTISLGLGILLQAQVGIGNPTPDSSSVLDLSNPNDKGLILPEATGQGAMRNTINGMTYFFDNNIFYKTDSGYNGVSPWKYRFNNNQTHNVYYNMGGNIGIGNTNLMQVPEAPLQIETVNNINLSDNGSLLIGKSTSNNLVINDKELQSRNAGSAAPLTINEDGGDITFGSNANKVNVKASDRMQELHSPTNTYYDLLPAGTIVMWYGNTSNIPLGWVLCNGGTHQRSDNTGSITTPDLSGRFIVATGSNGPNTYNPADRGGADAVTLTTNQMPSHTHSGNTSNAGAHSHNLQIVCAHDDDGTSTNATYSSHDSHYALGDHDANRNCPNTTTSSVSDHAHSFNTDPTGSGQAHENRPAYYSLVYMMKL